MATYDLATLVSRVRRYGGDRVHTAREAFIMDTTSTVTLSNEGSLTITSVTADGVVVDTANYSMVDNVMVFSPAQDESTNIVVIYTYSRYTDDESQEFLDDAAEEVQSDLGKEWTVDSVTHLITDDASELFRLSSGTRADTGIIKLIVLKAALLLREDLANTAADDAILIKDGETTIDTSKGAGGQSRILALRQDQYTAALREVQMRIYTGGFH